MLLHVQGPGLLRVSTLNLVTTIICALQPLVPLDANDFNRRSKQVALPELMFGPGPSSESLDELSFHCKLHPKRPAAYRTVAASIAPSKASAGNIEGS